MGTLRMKHLKKEVSKSFLQPLELFDNDRTAKYVSSLDDFSIKLNVNNVKQQIEVRPQG